VSTKSEPLWERFLAHCARARAKPTFDAEERDRKIKIAAQLRDAFAMTRDRGPWPDAVKAAFQEGLLIDLTVPSHRDWFKAWTAADPESLARALAGFLDRDANAQERLDSFARAATEADSGGATEAPHGAVLALGSLFNFAVEPDSLPLVRPWHFAELEQILGFERTAESMSVAAYPEHLGFARQVRARLEQSGLPVRDMIDVQSLIFIAALESSFWTGDRFHPIGVAPSHDQRPGSDGATPASYLSVCAIYRNEAPYLREWIEFHRLVGVERFFLYDNNSTDDHLRELAPYFADGVVTLHDWKVSPPVQRDTYSHCLAEHGGESRWIAFIDIDEFLFSPTQRPLPEMLTEYEAWPGVGVNWACFGSSGHRTKPAGLVTESYLMMVDAPANRFIKSIVDPARVSVCASAHHFIYDSVATVDENHYPIIGLRSKSSSFSKLRINHYVTKSEAEAQQKVGRGEGWEHSQRWRASKLEDAYPQHTDRAIMAYVPALKQVLQRTRGSVAAEGGAGDTHDFRGASEASEFP
jgi:glycosyl transferase family 92